MPNLAELASRMYILERKVEKLTPTISLIPTPTDEGTAVSGVTDALGIQLIGLTTIQRTALGVKLATLPDVKHILVYDTDDLTFYTWAGIAEGWV